ncbi:hypothetical protein [Lignipirellula cremea]|uniref:Uncharacterized protein n=1 Tax=Lignipirellula cremea TaxID=2528010 RepID=A0A518DV69_9BACT|nr:hypothetical protein [Lignipirellula cremea]QDU95730.1 hypothetical protein Pla8534_35470 [Lignipirellula cremea]
MNPYESPQAPDNPVAEPASGDWRSFPWFLIPAVISWGMGSIMLGAALVSLVCLVQARLANPPPVNLPFVAQEFWSSLLFYGCMGMLQLVAGGFWQGRAFFLALFLNAAGIFVLWVVVF